MTDESIFICDPRPNKHWILETNRELSPFELNFLDQDLRARMFWGFQTEQLRLVLPTGAEVLVTGDDHGWPDAEFCAA